MKQLLTLTALLILCSCQKEFSLDDSDSLAGVQVNFDNPSKGHSVDSGGKYKLFNVTANISGGTVYIHKFGWRVVSKRNDARLRDIFIRKDNRLMVWVSTTDTRHTYEPAVMNDSTIDIYSPRPIFPIKWASGTTHSFSMVAMIIGRSNTDFEIQMRAEDLIMTDSVGNPVTTNIDTALVSKWHIR